MVRRKELKEGGRNRKEGKKEKKKGNKNDREGWIRKKIIGKREGNIVRRNDVGKKGRNGRGQNKRKK